MPGTVRRKCVSCLSVSVCIEIGAMLSLQPPHPPPLLSTLFFFFLSSLACSGEACSSSAFVRLRFSLLPLGSPLTIAKQILGPYADVQTRTTHAHQFYFRQLLSSSFYSCTTVRASLFSKCRKWNSAAFTGRKFLRRTQPLANKHLRQDQAAISREKLFKSAVSSV